MIPEFKKLSSREQSVMLNAPVVVSVVAAMSGDGVMEQHEKNKATKIAQLRTYTSPVMLQDYYDEVNRNFEQNLTFMLEEVPKDKESQEQFLRHEVEKIKHILPKIDPDFAAAFAGSLKSFARHVFKSNSSVLEHFVLPILVDELEKDIFN